MIVKIRLEYQFYRGCGIVIIGTSTLNAWMEKMSKPDVPADELAIYALSRFFDRHTLIYTGVHPWTTLAPEHYNSVQEAHDRCQTHLVYLGHNMYGVLRPRPFINIEAPLTVDEVLNLMHLRQSRNPPQQEPLNLSVVPLENNDLDTGMQSDHTINSQAVSHTEVSETDVDVEEQVLPNDPAVPEVGVETTIQSDSPEDHSHIEQNLEEIVIPQPDHSVAYCHAVEDACDKNLKIKLVMMTNAELSRYLTTKLDNITNVDNTESETMDSDSKSIPSVANAITKPRCAPVNYAESSASEGGSIHGDTADDDWNGETEHDTLRPVQRHGPSQVRMAAQKLIANNKSAVDTPVNTPNIDQKSSSGSSRTHSPDSVAESSVSAMPNKPTQKHKGELTIKTHGIKKSRKERTFSCKECETLLLVVS